MLEHVTHEITIEALPTAIPESIPADVSGMAIGDTLQLSAITAPEGVEFALGEGVDADEVTIATLSPPRVEEEPEPEVEEEAELVGEEGEVPEGEEAPGRGRGPAEGELRPRATPARGSSPLSLLAGCAAAEARASPRPRRAPDRVLVVGLGNPERSLRGDPPQPRLRGRRRAVAALGAAAGQGALPRADHRGPGRPERPAGRGPPARRRS